MTTQVQPILDELEFLKGKQVSVCFYDNRTTINRGPSKKQSISFIYGELSSFTNEFVNIYIKGYASQECEIRPIQRKDIISITKSNV